MIETLARFSPDDELVVPFGSDSGLVALEVIPKERGLDSLRPLLEKGVICTRNAHFDHGRGREIVPPFPVRRAAYEIIGAGGPRSHAHSGSRLHRCTSETCFRWCGGPVEARTSSGRDADRGPAGPLQAFIEGSDHMEWTIDHPRGYVQSTLKPWLEETDDSHWPTLGEAFCLMHKEFAELDKAEPARMLTSEEVLSGSTLERRDFDGMRKVRSNPNMRRSYE